MTYNAIASCYQKTGNLNSCLGCGNKALTYGPLDRGGNVCSACFFDMKNRGYSPAQIFAYCSQLCPQVRQPAGTVDPNVTPFSMTYELYPLLTLQTNDPRLEAAKRRCANSPHFANCVQHYY